MNERPERLKRLNKLLQSHTGLTFTELEAKLDTEDRTLRKDLKMIQEPPYNAVLADTYSGRKKLYRYKDPHFTLPLFDAPTEDMKLKLNAAIEAVSQYETIPQYDWLKTCLLALESGNVADIGSIMSFENNDKLTGTKWLRPLIDAIKNKYPIKLAYQPYGKEEQTLYVHPYYLKQFNNRWFLIGRPDNINAIHNYAIDRIKNVEHLSKEFKDTDIEFEDYYDDVVGVSINDVEIEHIEMLVSKKRYPYIKTKPLHWTQDRIEEKDTDDRVCIYIEVKPNKELLTLLMSFGSDIIVTSPQSIRDEIAKRIKILAQAYNKFDGKTA